MYTRPIRPNNNPDANDPLDNHLETPSYKPYSLPQPDPDKLSTDKRYGAVQNTTEQLRSRLVLTIQGNWHIANTEATGVCDVTGLGVSPLYTIVNEKDEYLKVGQGIAKKLVPALGSKLNGTPLTNSSEE